MKPVVTVTNLFPKKALEKLNIVPINQASIDKLDFKEGADLFFSARFEVHPEIKLPKYQNCQYFSRRYLPIHLKNLCHF